MAVFSPDEERNVIPRWRTYEATLRIGELDSIASPRAHGLVVGDFLESKVVDWQRNKTVGHASDLVGAGVTLGREREGEVTKAARFLLREDLSVTPWARGLAKRALGEPDYGKAILEPEEIEEAILYGQIKTLRDLLRTEPNDPITWVELSRCYACIGLSEQAMRSMKVAQQLAVENRFVLRSASRLWINLGDPERAYDTIQRTDRTRHDPWLLAAELAIGSIAAKPPRLAKFAQGMLSRGQYSPIHISELASAVATLELGHGSVKKSKRWFNQSLEDPTENSIAQASWASRNYGAISFDLQLLNAPNTFEAETLSHYFNSEWENAVEKCKLWLYDQPFSSVPCMLGSALASITLEDYSAGEWFANRGLKANPSNFLLLNNLAFALANRGKIEEANMAVSRAAKSQSSPRDQAVLQATRGLLEFRTGNIERGCEFYSNAQALAKNIQSRDGDRVFAFASAFYAIEVASQHELMIQPVLPQALETIRRMPPDPILGVLERRLKALTSVGYHS